MLLDEYRSYQKRVFKNGFWIGVEKRGKITRKSLVAFSRVVTKASLLKENHRVRKRKTSTFRFKSVCMRIISAEIIEN